MTFRFNNNNNNTQPKSRHSFYIPRHGRQNAQSSWTLQSKPKAVYHSSFVTNRQNAHCGIWSWHLMHCS